MFDGIPEGWAAKIEDTEHTAETLAVGDALPVLAGTITPTVQRSTVSIKSPKGGRTRGIVTMRQAAFSLELPLYGRGLNEGNIVLPKTWSQILQTVGYIDTVSNADEAVWTPDVFHPRLNSTAAKKTFTLGTWIGRAGSIASGTKIFRSCFGCRVGTLRLQLTVGEIARMFVDGVGMYVEDADVTTDLSTYAADTWAHDYVTPNALQCTVGGRATALNQCEITFDFGARHVMGDTLTSGNGVSGTAVTDVTATMTLNPVVVLQSTYDWITQIHSGAPLAVAMAAAGIFPPHRETNQGYGWKFAVPEVQALGGTYERDTPIRLPLQLDINNPTLVTDPFSMTLF